MFKRLRYTCKYNDLVLQILKVPFVDFDSVVHIDGV